MGKRLSELKLDFGYVSAKLEEYKEKCKTPTFRGFMLELGLNRRLLEQMKSQYDAYADKERYKHRNTLQLLEDYKDELEVKMEEYMIYQGKHPDLIDVPDYNFKNLEFILRASNPNRYSNVKYLESNNKKQDSMKILKNESSIKLINDTN